MLTAWRYGGWGVLVPVALFVLSLLLGAGEQLWAWWIPFASLTGAWMGLREEGGGPSGGDRTWMLLPLLLLAATIPWTAPYEGLKSQVLAVLNGKDIEVARLTLDETSGGAATREAMLRGLAFLKEHHQDMIPTALFLWMVLLVAAGRSLSARAAAALHWPAVSRAARHALRVPDGVLWILLLGLGLWLAPWPRWTPTAWTLILNSALAFCVQGIVVVESLLLARGLPPSLIILTMVFVFTMAWPIFAGLMAAVGVSDVWLDYRRLENPSERVGDGK